MEINQGRRIIVIIMASLITMSTAYAMTSGKKKHDKHRSHKASVQARNAAFHQNLAIAKLKPASNTPSGSGLHPTTYSLSVRKTGLFHQNLHFSLSSRVDLGTTLITTRYINNQLVPAFNALRGAVLTNANNIQANALLIQNNQQGIENNAANIGVLQGVVSFNAANIALNKASIRQNTQNLQTSADLIKQVASVGNINAKNISELGNSVGRLSTQLASIAQVTQVNAQNIVRTDREQSRITNNQRNIAADEVDNADDIKANYERILQNASQIVSNAIVNKDEAVAHEFDQADIRKLQQEVFANTSALGSRTANFGSFDELPQPTYNETIQLVGQAHTDIKLAAKITDDFGKESPLLKEAINNLYAALSSEAAERNPAIAKSLNHAIKEAVVSYKNSEMLSDSSKILVARAQAGDHQAMAAVKKSRALQALFNSSQFQAPFKAGQQQADAAQSAASKFNPAQLVSQLVVLLNEQNDSQGRYLGYKIRQPMSVRAGLVDDQGFVMHQSHILAHIKIITAQLSRLHYHLPADIQDRVQRLEAGGGVL